MARVALLLALLAGPPDLPEAPAAAYDGPPLEISLEVMESAPPQYAVSIAGKAPGAGWTLSILGKAPEAGATVVRVRLLEHRLKAPEGASRAAGDPLSARLHLGLAKDLGREVRVLVQVDCDLPGADHAGPPFRLAKVLPVG